MVATCAVLILAATAIPDSADAQSGARRSGAVKQAETINRRVSAAERRAERPRPVAAPKPIPVPRIDPAQRPPEPLVAVISLAGQRMNVYGPSGQVASTQISSGRSGYATPTGIFSILQRNRYHESNIYSGAPMPFMQRLTWSGIALHQGVVPGHPASHGCIRMPSGFAEKMWGIGRLGMRVLVTPGEVSPQPAAHPRLPMPVMTPGATALAATPVAASAGGAADPAPPPDEVAPYPLAHLRRQQAQAELAIAERELKGAQDAAAERSAEANRIGDQLRAAVSPNARLEDELAALQEDIARTQSEASEAELRLRLEAAKARLDGDGKALAEVRRQELAASDAAFDAAKALRAVQDRVEQAQAAVRATTRGLEPISIFVSRKEGRVFVRQGFVEIHEEPISIAEPIRPLGTHVFTAMDGGVGAPLRWIAVTLPSSPPIVDPDNPRARAKATPVALQSVPPQSSAATVLDRFELPAATLKLVGDRLWAGASLIVSDFGIGPETGKGTDFVVLTK